MAERTMSLRYAVLVGGSSDFYAKVLFRIDHFMRIIWRYQSSFENP